MELHPPVLLLWMGNDFAPEETLVDKKLPEVIVSFVCQPLSHLQFEMYFFGVTEVHFQASNIMASIAKPKNEILAN